MPKLVQIYLEFIFPTDVTDEMIQMPSGPGGDSPAQNAESIKIEEHNPPQVNPKMSKKAKKTPRKVKNINPKIEKAAIQNLTYLKLMYIKLFFV